MWEQSAQVVEKMLPALTPCRRKNHRNLASGHVFKTLIWTWTHLWMIIEIRNNTKSLLVASKIWLSWNSLVVDNMFSIFLQIILIQLSRITNYNMFSKTYGVRQQWIWCSDLSFVTLETEHTVTFMNISINCSREVATYCPLRRLIGAIEFYKIEQ